MNIIPPGGVIGVLGDLVDALNDELAYEVSQSPHVQEHVRVAIAALGGPYVSYLDSWWLGGSEPRWPEDAAHNGGEA